MRHPFLQGTHNAGRFQDQSVVDRYHLRPAYPPETFTILNELIVDEPRVVLDIGCGTGNITRPLAGYVERIDAVDLSLPMIERARTLPGGDSSKIHWLNGRAEDVALAPPYALVTAGESLHWMEWDVVLPRLAHVLTQHGMLAIAYVGDQSARSAPWSAGAQQIRQRFTNNPTYQPFDWIAKLEKYRLFQKLGERQTDSIAVAQTIEDYIAAQHARSTLSLDTMTAEQATQFDREMQALLLPFAQDGLLTFSVVGGIIWGKPQSGESRAKQAFH
jgi:2-polyprenyl-3-methyl-5-hydroxy-6-metoxy-1,4-benzoquinol methylase